MTQNLPNRTPFLHVATLFAASDAFAAGLWVLPVDVASVSLEAQRLFLRRILYLTHLKPRRTFAGLESHKWNTGGKRLVYGVTGEVDFGDEGRAGRRCLGVRRWHS